MNMLASSREIPVVELTGIAFLSKVLQETLASRGAMEAGDAGNIASDDVYVTNRYRRAGSLLRSAIMASAWSTTCCIERDCSMVLWSVRR